jgi:predicted DsbA family dithiol-disulfide isomerase
VRLRRLEAEFPGRIEMLHRSFVLLGEERSGRVFLDYHRTHRQAAAQQDSDAPRFEIPAAGHAYPRSSFPALEAAAWVRDTQPDRFAAFDLALFEGFFGHTEDISDPDVLCRLGRECGVDPARLGEVLAGASMRPLVLQETDEAFRLGIRGIPAVVIPGRPPIVGAVRYPDLEQAVRDALETPQAIR